MKSQTLLMWLVRTPNTGKKTFAELKKDTLCFDTTKNSTLWNSMIQVNAKVKELAIEDSTK